MARSNKTGAVAAAVENDTVYLVNPGGAVHIVSVDHARMRIKEYRGFRLATDSEIEAYQSAGGNQISSAPIARLDDVLPTSG